MFQPILFSPNRNPKQEFKPYKNMQKNQLPQLNKYIEDEKMKRSIQKEQEKRQSLQQQSNEIEKEIQNRLFHQQKIHKKERNLYDGYRNSLFLNAADMQHNRYFNQQLYNFNQYSFIDQQQINKVKDEASNRQRSITINIKNKKYSHFDLLEEEIPISQKNKLIDCNQVLDFRISVDSKQTKNQMESKQNKYILNYINFLQSRFNQPYQLVKEEFEKIQKSQNLFKQWSLIFIFIFRLNKILRQKKIQYVYNLKDLKTRVEACNQQQVAEIKLIWLEQILKKLLLTMQQTRFTQNFKQNQSSNDQKFINKRKLWMMNLTSLFFQNLYNMTKAENLSKDILEQAQYNIFEINKKGSLFVAKRIKTKLIKIEQLLLICDCIFFKFIIDKIISDSNQIICINNHHLAECKFQLLSICSLIQILFMNYFWEMQQYQPNISKIIQKRLSINKNQNQNLQIIEDQVIEQNETIIVGLNNFEFYEQFVKQNQKWYDDIQKLFTNSINNLASQNNI